MSVRGLIALAITMITLAITATSASAATSRADWVAQADPICKSGVDQEFVVFSQQQAAIKQSRKQARRLTRKHAKRHPRLHRRLRERIDRIQAAAFTQFIAIERGVDAQLATLTPAPSDESLVQVWLRARGELLDAYGLTLLDSSRTDGDDFQDFFKLLGLLYETNDMVRDVGFQYCAHPTSAIVVVGD